jgi:hypothetical protein
MSFSMTGDSTVCFSFSTVIACACNEVDVEQDHITHQVLSIYALGAGPPEIKAAYKRNASYQRPVFPTDTNVVQAMRDTPKFMQCLGKEENYPNFLAFFQQEIDAKGVGDVLNEYVFKGDERAESMLSRLYAGEYLWPVIVYIGLVSGLIQPRPHSPTYSSGVRTRVQPAGHCGAGSFTGGCAR